MKAVFLSDVSPRRVGVFGMRVASFAAAMARRGHEIVVLFPTHSETEERTDASRLAGTLLSHDWSRPLDVSYHPVPTPLIRAIHQDKLPAIVRRPLTLAMIVATGGVHGHYVSAARPFVEALADAFRPDVVWGNFGNTSNLVIAQQLARRARAPWVMDLKDNWEAFLRPALRRIVADRFRDAAGFTANAEYHATMGGRWHRQRNVVLYSGVAPEMIAPVDTLPDRDKFVITLIGGVYHAADLVRYLDALRRWLATLAESERKRISFRYAGSGAKIVSKAIAATPLGCDALVDVIIPHSELASLSHRAGVNTYLWAGAVGFHHKLLELMVCRRPAIVFPGEHEESKRLAREVGGELVVCASEAELEAAFGAMFRRWQSGAEPQSQVDPDRISWDTQAERLEAFLQEAIGAARGGSRHTTEALAS